MKRKQFLALLLSASMMATSGVPAYAADVSDSSEVTYSAEGTEPGAPSENGTVTTTAADTPETTTTQAGDATVEDEGESAPQADGTADTPVPAGDETTPSDDATTPSQDAATPSDDVPDPSVDDATTPSGNVTTPDSDAAVGSEEGVTTPEQDVTVPPAKAPAKAPAQDKNTEQSENEKLSDVQKDAEGTKARTVAADETGLSLTGDEPQNGADFMVGAKNFVGHYKTVDDNTVDMVYASLRYADPEWPEDGTMDVTEVTVPATIKKDGKTYKVRDVWFDRDNMFSRKTETLTFEEGINSVSAGALKALKTLNLPSTLTRYGNMSSTLKDGTPASWVKDMEGTTINFAGNDFLKYDADAGYFYSTERGGGACDAVGDQFSQYTFKYEVVGDGTVDIIDMFESQVDENVNVTVPSKVSFKGKNFKVRNVVLDEYTNFDQCKQLRSLTFENGIEKFRLPTRGGMLFPEAYSKIERINVPASMKIENAGGHPELKAFEVNAANPYMTSIDGVLFSKDKTELIGFPAAKGGESYTVPASVKTLKDGSFMFAKDLRNLIVPSTVETMEQGSLTCTLGVNNITIDHVENMYSNLNDCYGTEVITIKGIEELPQGFISDNPDLKTINIEGNITYKGPYALTGNTALEAYNVKNASIISSKDGVLYNFGTIWSYPAGKKNETFVIPEDVYEIGANAFYNTQYLKKLICPKGVVFSTASINEPAKAVDVYLSDLDTIHLDNNFDNIFISSVGGHVYAPNQTVLNSILNHENQDALNGMTAAVGFIPADTVQASDDAITINKGGTKQLNVKVTPAYATEPITYEVTNDVCSVSADGVVTGLKAGKGTITVKSSKGKDTINVTVTSSALKSMKFTSDTFSLNKGDVKKLGITFNPTDADVSKLALKSSNEKVVKINEKGEAVAVSAGTATITATCNGVTATCKVTVKVPLQSISMSEKSKTLNVGDSFDLDVTTNPADATVSEAVKWSSDNTGVASVDKNGNVTAKGAGTATITASAGGKKATCKVTVKIKEVALQSIKLSASEVSLTEGGTKQLSVSYNPSNTTVDKTVKWSSNKSSVATVGANGKITAKGVGTAKITATVAGKTATCTVTVSKKQTDIALNSIELSASEVSLTEGGTKQLSVKYNPSNTTVDKTVRWSSNKSSVATVNADGKITAKGVGTAKITATVAGKTATCTVTVSRKQIPLDSVSIAEGDISVDINATKRLNVTCSPSDTTEDVTVKWSSDNEFIATVDGNGVVTGVRGGTAVITAEANGKKATCTVTVTVPDTELPYTDVSESDWFYNEVAEMYHTGTMTGTDPDTFAPYDPVARAQFAVIVYRLLGSPEVEYSEQYPDVGDDIWYTDAITYASNMGIITGYSDTGKFGPSDDINREQLAVMLYRFCNATGSDTSARGDLSKFEDGGRVNDFAREAMEWAVGTGIITGKDNETKCDPQGRASRAECAIMLSRFFKVK